MPSRIECSRNKEGNRTQQSERKGWHRLPHKVREVCYKLLRCYRMAAVRFHEVSDVVLEFVAMQQNRSRKKRGRD